MALVGLLALKEKTHREAVLSEREAGERRLSDARAQFAAWHCKQIDAIEKAAHAVRDAHLQHVESLEKALDRLQARSVLEYQAARQVAAMVPQAEAPAEAYDPDFENPSFARPEGWGRQQDNGAVEVMD